MPPGARLLCHPVGAGAVCGVVQGGGLLARPSRRSPACLCEPRARAPSARLDHAVAALRTRRPLPAALLPAVPTLAPRTLDTAAGPARLLALPTPTPDVVSFRASLLTAPDLAVGDDVAQALVADLLDKGTRSRDRFALADALDGRGARLSFYSDGLRLGFAGRALRADLPDVLALTAEMLLTPLFDADEVRKAQQQAAASIRQSRESTGAMASGALARRLYGPAHPNFVHTPEAETALVLAATPEALAAYHVAHIGSDGFTLAVVGDVDPDALAATAARVFAGLGPHGRTAAYSAHAAPEAPGQSAVPMADRPNLDVRLGHAVALCRTDADFVPLYAGVFALGGNFSSRLMQTIRDEQGLTYGISAALAGVAAEHDCDLRLSVGLSSDALATGTAAVRAEVERFVAEGVSEPALAATRTTLAGQHVVGLATTGGLAARLLVNAERGFAVDYLDGYPDLVRALTTEGVTGAVRRHVRPDALHQAVAGTLPADAAAVVAGVEAAV